MNDGQFKREIFLTDLHSFCTLRALNSFIKLLICYNGTPQIQYLLTIFTYLLTYLLTRLCRWINPQILMNALRRQVLVRTVVVTLRVDTAATVHVVRYCSPTASPVLVQMTCWPTALWPLTFWPVSLSAWTLSVACCMAFECRLKYTPCPHKRLATHFFTITFTNGHGSLLCSFASEY